MTFTMLVGIVTATGATSMFPVGSYSSLSVCETERTRLVEEDRLAVSREADMGIKSDLRVWRQCMRKT